MSQWPNWSASPPSVDTFIDDSGMVVQTISIGAQVAKTVTDVAAAQKEAAVRQRLIQLGWTPPEGGQE